MKKLFSAGLRWLVSTVLWAAVCVGARLWQRSTAFEGPLELPIPMAPASVVMTILLLLCAVGLFLLAQQQRVAHALHGNYERALHMTAPIFTGAMVAAAVLALIAAPLLFRTGWQFWGDYRAALASGVVIPGSTNGLLLLVAAATSLLACVGILLAARSAGRPSKRGLLWLTAPAVNNCLWLMEVYRLNAANPVRWDYTPLTLAIVFGILFYLDWVGLYAGSGAPRRTLWMAAMTVILSAVALAGEWDLSSALLLTSQLMAALVLLLCLPNNLKHPPEPAPAPAQAEEKLEEETHE